MQWSSMRRAGPAPPALGQMGWVRVKACAGKISEGAALKHQVRLCNSSLNGLGCRSVPEL